MALPGNGTVLADDPRARGAGPSRPRASIIDADRHGPDAARHRHAASRIDNAFALDMAMGGSTNTVLHTLAIAHEAGRRLPPGPHQRARRARAEHLQGRPSVALPHGGRGPRRRRPRHPERDRPRCPALLHLDRPTVTGKTLGENIAGAASQRHRRHPPPATTRTAPTGGLADPVRQPGPGRRGGQDGGRARRRCCSYRGPGARLRIPGRRPARHPRRQGAGRATSS